jgi:hypothetical protein
MDREIRASAFFFLLTWDSRPLHNMMEIGCRHGRRRPVAIRGVARIGSRDGGWFDASHRLARTLRSFLPFPEGIRSEGVVCVGKNINCRNLHRAIMMFMTLLGFLLAVLVLAAFIRWYDPTCRERIIRLVRGPVPAFARRPARRFLPTALPWWCFPIMGPPDLPEPTQCRRSRLFRRF